MATREELLSHLWRHVINVHLNPDALQAQIDHSRRRPDDPFADTGPALERLLAAGADPHDICLVQRDAAYAATFATLYAIGDPGVDNGNVLMLFEDLLSADPSGMEGRPGSAGAA
ncbi:hypothetical protein [Luteimonas aquatica]|uniref:hypothetical protein n=1 Tax=Luteimonas aquatica TaxID=450364 RepID=UPI001F56A564|nr:hypothetical protein [Luteimonas aquatica]